MKYKLFSEVALSVDFPEYSLYKGDIGTIVEYYEPNEFTDDPGYSLEVFDTTGESIRVITVKESQIQSLKRNAVFSMRELKPA